MRLAIIGASARAASFSALAAGFDVVAADLFADADLAARCPTTRIDQWPESFGPWLAAAECDGWLMTGGLENYPDLVQQWSHEKPLLGVGRTALEIVRAPEQLAGALASIDLPFPTTHNSLPDARLAGEWLVKRLRSSGGWGVRPWQPGINLTADEEVLQQRIEGIPISAVYVSSSKTTTCWGISRQLIAPAWTHATGFKYAGSIGLMPLPHATRERIALAGATVGLAANMTGVWGIDFVLAQDGTPWVIEVNPRYTASMEVIERATGQSAIGFHVAACRSEPLPLADTSDKNATWGKAYLFAPHDLCPSREFTQHLHELAVEGRAADLPYPGDPIAKGMPITTLLARGETADEVELALETGLNELTARLTAYEGAPRVPIFPAGDITP